MDSSGLPTRKFWPCSFCGSFNSNLASLDCVVCGQKDPIDWKNAPVGCSIKPSYNNFSHGGSSRHFYNIPYQNDYLGGHSTQSSSSHDTVPHVGRTSTQTPIKSSRETFYRDSVRQSQQTSYQGSIYSNTYSIDATTAATASFHGNATTLQEIANMLLDVPLLRNLFCDILKRYFFRPNYLEQALHHLLRHLSSDLHSEATNEEQHELARLLAQNAKTVAALLCRTAESSVNSLPIGQQPLVQYAQESKGASGLHVRRSNNQSVSSETDPTRSNQPESLSQQDTINLKAFITHSSALTTFCRDLESVVYPPRGVSLFDVACWVAIVLGWVLFRLSDGGRYFSSGE